MSAMVVDSISLSGRWAQHRVIVAWLAASASAGFAIVGASLGPTGEIAAAATAAGLLLVVLLWRFGATAAVVFVAAAALVEQYPIVGDGTDRIPLFTSLSALGLTSVYVTPIEFILAAAIVVWVLKAGAERRLHAPRSPLSIGLLLFMVMVGFGEFYGVARGGQFNVALNELRPWLYLTLLFLVTSQLVQGRRALQAMLWAFILATGFKGLQGVFQWLQVRSLASRPESILAHEEAFFFGVFILLVAGLWFFGLKGAMRRVATLLLPFVVLADLANARRTSWLILFAGLIVLVLATWIHLPRRRSAMAGLVLGLAALSLLYFPLFWNSTRTIAQPARAVHSVVAPVPRDLSSNRYRVEEDVNLALNIMASPLVGVGFGIPIAYTARIVDLTGVSLMLKYVPHDGALYIWMRLGALGALAFWSTIGAAFVLAGSLLRRADRWVALAGYLALCALAAYAIQGSVDLGFYWYRIAVFMGCLLGAVQGLAGQTYGDLADR